MTATPCSVDGCETIAWCRGWCTKHYRRWQRTGDPQGLGANGHTKNRHKTHCPKGHPYDEANTIVYVRPSTGREHRYCRECRRLRRIYRQRGYRRYLADRCERCGFVAEDPCQLDMHHRDHNHKNNLRSNLATLCANCHRLEHQRQKAPAPTI